MLVTYHYIVFLYLWFLETVNYVLKSQGGRCLVKRDKSKNSQLKLLYISPNLSYWHGRTSSVDYPTHYLCIQLNTMLLNGKGISWGSLCFFYTFWLHWKLSTASHSDHPIQNAKQNFQSGEQPLSLYRADQCNPCIKFESTKTMACFLIMRSSSILLLLGWLQIQAEENMKATKSKIVL